MTLLPCPFCGGTTEKSKESDWNDGLNHLITAYSVTCTNSECSANVFGFRDESEAIAAWNRRAVPEGFVLVPVESLKEALYWIEGDSPAFEYASPEQMLLMYPHRTALLDAVEAQEKKNG